MSRRLRARTIRKVLIINSAGCIFKQRFRHFILESIQSSEVQFAEKAVAIELQCSLTCWHTRINDAETILWRMCLSFTGWGVSQSAFKTHVYGPWVWRMHGPLLKGRTISIDWRDYTIWLHSSMELRALRYERRGWEFDPLWSLTCSLGRVDRSLSSKQLYGCAIHSGST